MWYTNEYRARIDAAVNNACRENVDPLFHNAAKNAAWNGRYVHYVGDERMNFLYPTTYWRGYFSVLKYIIENPGIKRKQIYEHFKAAISITITRLLAGKLIQNRDTHFYATEDGTIYALTAANYLCKRNIVTSHN